MDTLKVIKQRRSIRKSIKDETLDESILEKRIEAAIKASPTAFNAQGSMVVLLLNTHHEMLWDITTEAVLKETEYSQKEKTEAKLNQFRQAHGTILFFEDEALEEHYKEKIPFVKDQVHDWAMQSNGMLQYSIWLLLEAMDLSASLQHYNPLIDQAVQETFKIDKRFRLVAQMPFGQADETVGEKKQKPLEDRFKLYK